MKKSEKVIRNRIKRFVTTEFQGMYTILWNANLLEKDIKKTAENIFLQMCEEGLFEVVKKNAGDVAFYNVRKK